MTVPPEGRADFHDQSIGTAVGHHNTINITYHNGEVRTVEVFRLIDPIDDFRREAAAWKAMHARYQQISFKLADVCGAVAGEGLTQLEGHWLDCRDQIQSFVELEWLSKRGIKQRFITANHKSRWLDNINSDASALDVLIGECKEPEDLTVRMVEIHPTLRRIERNSRTLFRFLDDQLHRVFEELADAIAQARDCLIEPPNSAPPRSNS